jgi:hypothetical protein
MSGDGATADTDLAKRRCENVTPIITQYAPKDIFNVDKSALFYDVQLKRTPTLNAEKCQGEKGYTARATVMLCCNAEGSERTLPLIAGKSGNPLSLKGLKNYYPWACRSF